MSSGTRPAAGSSAPAGNRRSTPPAVALQKAVTRRARGGRGSRGGGGRRSGTARNSASLNATEKPPHGASQNASEPEQREQRQQNQQRERGERERNQRSPPAPRDFAARFEQLKVDRTKARNEAIATGKMADPSKPISLSHAITPTGTCTDMCPEFERVERIVQKMVDKCEKTNGPAGLEIAEGRMIKRFRRSAAGYDEQLPSDIRTPNTLLQTMNFLIRHVLSTDDTLGSVHKFVWDRTRSIRNDLSVQQLTQIDDVKVAVKCLERIARFHILSLHLMSSPEHEEPFDHHQEREQLNNTLLSLLYYYDDHRDRVQFPNEDEFRAYYIIFSIHDSRPDLEARVQAWPRELRCAPRVQIALELLAAGGNTWEYRGVLDCRRSSPIAQGFYTRFFNLVRSKSTSYLLACVAEIYFNQVRQTAIRSIWKAYCRQPLSQAEKNQEWTLDELRIVLCFDTNDQAMEFCQEQGLSFVTNSDGRTYLTWSQRSFDEVDFQPSGQQVFSYSLVESKRCGRTLQALVLGMNVEQACRLHMIDQSLLPNVHQEDESLFVSNEDESKTATHGGSDEAPKSQLSASASPFVPSSAPPPLQTSSPFSSAFGTSTGGTFSSIFSSGLSAQDRNTNPSPFGRPSPFAFSTPQSTTASPSLFTFKPSHAPSNPFGSNSQPDVSFAISTSADPPKPSLFSANFEKAPPTAAAGEKGAVGISGISGSPAQSPAHKKKPPLFAPSSSLFPSSSAEHEVKAAQGRAETERQNQAAKEAALKEAAARETAAREEAAKEAAAKRQEEEAAEAAKRIMAERMRQETEAVERQAARLRELTRLENERLDAARREVEREKAELRAIARHRQEAELQSARRDIEMREAASRKATERQQQQLRDIQHEIEMDIYRQKEQQRNQQQAVSPERLRFSTSESPLTIDELSHQRISQPPPSMSLTPSASDPSLFSSSASSISNKPAIDEDELLLSAARLTANTLANGRHLFNGIRLPDSYAQSMFSRSLPSSIQSFLGDSYSRSQTPGTGTKGMSEFSKSNDVNMNSTSRVNGVRNSVSNPPVRLVNGYPVALAAPDADEILGLGRSLSRTEQRIRQTGAHGLASIPVPTPGKEKVKSKTKEKRKGKAKARSEKVNGTPETDMGQEGESKRRRTERPAMPEVLDLTL